MKVQPSASRMLYKRQTMYSLCELQCCRLICVLFILWCILMGRKWFYHFHDCTLQILGCFHPWKKLNEIYTLFSDIQRNIYNFYYFLHSFKVWTRSLTRRPFGRERFISRFSHFPYNFHRNKNLLSFFCSLFLHTFTDEYQNQ